MRIFNEKWDYYDRVGFAKLILKNTFYNKRNTSCQTRLIAAFETHYFQRSKCILEYQIACNFTLTLKQARLRERNFSVIKCSSLDSAAA